MEVTTDNQQLLHCPHPAEHVKKQESEVEEGKEGEHCRWKESKDTMFQVAERSCICFCFLSCLQKYHVILTLCVASEWLTLTSNLHVIEIAE